MEYGEAQRNTSRGARGPKKRLYKTKRQCVCTSLSLAYTSTMYMAAAGARTHRATWRRLCDDTGVVGRSATELSPCRLLYKLFSSHIAIGDGHGHVTAHTCIALGSRCAIKAATPPCVKSRSHNFAVLTTCQLVVGCHCCMLLLPLARVIIGLQQTTMNKPAPTEECESDVKSSAVWREIISRPLRYHYYPCARVTKSMCNSPLTTCLKFNRSLLKDFGGAHAQNLESIANAVTNRRELLNKFWCGNWDWAETNLG